MREAQQKFLGIGTLRQRQGRVSTWLDEFFGGTIGWHKKSADVPIPKPETELGFHGIRHLGRLETQPRRSNRN